MHPESDRLCQLATLTSCALSFGSILIPTNAFLVAFFIEKKLSEC